ncbi:MAG: bifunctional (p)ppGpp synthetase/guanosine-3',5'-bis(diphosphate) 3'-pyrophosphohydrolase [Lachnospiraceae bacterium]|nr:bifunctional (p)ppGpp synthetase/guanosine-3',5'-bis(diphosphate) 3'-pyrophosphohydrolase [Lachnospiraceae bacterium]
MGERQKQNHAEETIPKEDIRVEDVPDEKDDSAKDSTERTEDIPMEEVTVQAEETEKEAAAPIGEEISSNPADSPKKLPANRNPETDGLIQSEESIAEINESDPEALYRQLIATLRRYRPNTDLSMIERAYEVASKAHEGQKRKSGEPYIIHPICTAIILAELELDKETIAAGLLHDVVEDTAVTKEQIVEWFGQDVADLVDGVTKLTRLSYDVDKVEEQAENLRKMFLAMAKDIRVILIKLADRLHNMRTLEYQTPAKRREKARETMDIYAPIASRLGISKVKIELDDLSLSYLEPEKYQNLVEQVNKKMMYNDDYIRNLIAEVAGIMEEAQIKATVNGRVKHYFSIYKKMVNQNKTLDQIYDIFAVRIIVDSVRDCYAALGVIHEKYIPVPGRFKDYIAMPKPNMYQSLHTTLMGKNGQPFEIQIRTVEMHRTAEYGIAAHWKYKENPNGAGVSGEEEKLSWLRQILEWQRDMDDNHEFMSLLKSDLDLFSENVYCFTPKGDVKTLPKGSTPIDFAYSIHSAVGNKMVGARVNGRMVTIDYTIHNGDRIEIITSQNSTGPSRDWLKIVKSSQAKTKINQWFREQMKEDNIIRGKELVDRYCKARGINQSEVIRPPYVEKILRRYSFRDWESILAAIGHGGLKESQVVDRLVAEYNKEHAVPLSDEEAQAQIEENIARGQNRQKMTHGKGGILVKGMDNVAVHTSRCCGPVPGDEIIGFITRGRGVTVHRTDCVNIINLPEIERARLIEVEWETDAVQSGGEGEKYTAEINIYCDNRTGLLADISKIFNERNIDVSSINSRTSKTGDATISMSFQVRGKEELDGLITKIRGVPNVVDVVRTTG